MSVARDWLFTIIRPGLFERFEWNSEWHYRGDENEEKSENRLRSTKTQKCERRDRTTVHSFEIIEREDTGYEGTLLDFKWE